MNMQKTVALVGLMGCGKSRVGKLLAKKCQCAFYDADQEIIAAAGQSITEIFAQYGETAFRRGEFRVIERLLNDASPCILATGGGAFVQTHRDHPTHDLLKEKSLTIWLDISLETALKRTAKSKKRPLLNQGNPEEILTRLMHERTPFYAKADIHIDANQNNPDKTVEEIYKKIQDKMSW